MNTDENIKDNITLKDVLNKYIDILNCSAKELSIISGVQEAVISRYRNGETIPKSNSIQVERLINGIVEIASKKNIPNINKKNVIDNFNKAVENIDFENIRLKLNLLIETLNINISDISKYLNYNSSYFYRIRTGTRKPANIYDFLCSIIEYIEKKYNDDISKKKILLLINKEDSDFDYIIELKIWFSSNIKLKQEDNKIDIFLKELDTFNLEDYIKVIHFDEIKVPTIPLSIPKTKYYYGLNSMKQGEIDFLKGTVMSKNKGNVFMWSDMQMDDMMQDVEFGKKWMLGIALMIKKGLHINVIHNLDRPFKELMGGLESWIPIYMTGQVSPYYIKDYTNKIHSHLNYISGSYVLCGECVVGHHNKGKYYLTNNKNELEFYQEKAKLLLKKATPLMDIYDNNNITKMKDFFEEDLKTTGNRKRILSNLPFHTLSEKLLIKIAKNNKLSNKDINILKNSLLKEQEYIKEITKNNKLIDEVILLSEQDFSENIFSMNLSKYISNLELKYNYDEYLEHYNESKKYKNKNYKIVINNNQIFKNIDIYINENKYVVISKKNNPNIHFVIRHKKLVNSIEKFIPPIIDTK